VLASASRDNGARSYGIAQRSVGVSRIAGSATATEARQWNEGRRREDKEGDVWRRLQAQD
jgi:hypothetical protein